MSVDTVYTFKADIRMAFGLTSVWYIGLGEGQNQMFGWSKHTIGDGY